MKYNNSGMEKILKKIDKLSNKKIRFDNLFNKSFMEKYTDFSSFQEFIDATELKIENVEDFKNLSEEELNPFIKKYTIFQDWEGMYKKAGELYFKKKFK